jgi:hypothetical protein
MDLFLRLYFRLNFNRINTVKLRNLNKKIPLFYANLVPIVAKKAECGD